MYPNHLLFRRCFPLDLIHTISSALPSRRMTIFWQFPLLAEQDPLLTLTRYQAYVTPAPGLHHTPKVHHIR